jgi:hypothetical protein
MLYLASMLDFRFAHVALPSDAVECQPWHRHGENDWRRFFLTREWNISEVWVSVAGEQDHHGEVKRWLHVGGEDHCSTSDRRELIAALTDAGHLLDSLQSFGVGSSLTEPPHARQGGPCQ